MSDRRVLSSAGRRWRAWLRGFESLCRTRRGLGRQCLWLRGFERRATRWAELETGGDHVPVRAASGRNDLTTLLTEAVVQSNLMTA